MVGLATAAGLGFLGILTLRAAIGGQDECGFHLGDHREGSACTCRHGDAPDASGFGSTGMIGPAISSSPARAVENRPAG